MPTVFVLRVERLTHKVQYSKVGKGDVSAAVLGTIVATFVGYLALASLGSGAIDLSDLTVCLWYALLAYLGLREARLLLVLRWRTFELLGLSTIGSRLSPQSHTRPGQKSLLRVGDCTACAFPALRLAG